MRKKTFRYRDDKGELAGDWRRIRDDLPTPDELAGEMSRQTKVTLALDDDAIAFFKREASRRKTSYQRMIRNLVRSYARAHASSRKLTT
jgi:predicted DNA binding CopG/RHH family protein